MPDTKLSALTAGSLPFADSDLVYGVLSAASRKLAISDLRSAMQWPSDSTATANATAKANYVTPCNLTSAFTLTAPASPQAGDFFGFLVTGVTSTNTVTAAANTGQTLDNGNYGDSKGYLVGDYCIWRYTGTKWYVFEEGRQRHLGGISQGTAITSGSAGTYYTMTLDTVITNPSGIVSTGSQGIVIRRPGTYALFCTGVVRTAALAFIRFYINSTADVNFGVYTGVDQNMTVPVSLPQKALLANDLVQMQGYYSSAGAAVNFSTGKLYALELSK